MRKTKLTPDTQRSILRRVRAGVPLPTACMAVGVPWSTCKGWLHRGRHADVDEEGDAVDEADAPYVAFADAFDQARAGAVSSRLVRVNRAGRKGNVSADLWWLEKRVPAFAPHSARKGKGDDMPSLPAAVGGDTRTILLYPVPMPPGADPRAIAAAAARVHAFERVDDDEEGGK